MIFNIPWITQPKHTASPSNSPLSRGLVLLWNGATPRYDAIQGIPTTVSGTLVQRGFTNNLISPDFNGTSVDFRWNRAVTGTNPSEVTLFGLCSLDSVATERTIIGMSWSSTTTPLFRIELNGTGFWQAQFRGGTGTANVSGGSAPAANRLYFIVGVFRSGTGLKELWVDGVQVATSSTDVGTVDLNQTEIGVLVRSGAAQWWDGVIPIAGMYNRALNSEEIVSLTRNPWQLFKPLTRRLWFGVTSTGATLIDLTAASFRFTGQSIQPKTTVNLSTNSNFLFSGKTVQTSLVSQLSAATFRFTANSIAVGGQIIIDLSRATFNFVGKAITTIQNTAIQLGAASFRFVGNSITVTGAVAAVKRGGGMMMMLARKFAGRRHQNKLGKHE